MGNRLSKKSADKLNGSVLKKKQLQSSSIGDPSPQFESQVSEETAGQQTVTNRDVQDAIARGNKNTY